MKHLLVLLLASAALAGCVDDSETPPAHGDDGEPRDPIVVQPGSIDFTIENGGESTTGRSWTFTGTIDRAASLMVTSCLQPCEEIVMPTEDDKVADINGTWEWTFTHEEAGAHSVLLSVTAEDGASMGRGTSVTFLAEGTMEVRFRGEVPPREDPSGPAHMDISGFPEFPSATLYEGCEASHPGYPTAHDFMVVWAEEHDISIEGSCGSSGFFLESFDNHQNPGFWCYTLNGEAADGMSIQKWSEGDAIIWDSCNNLGIG